MTEPKRFFVNHLFCLLILLSKSSDERSSPPIVGAVHNCRRYVNVDSIYFFSNNT